MKWFHHECAASHDPKLQILGSTHGAEGIGIYWGILEAIGQHSDTFHLKVMRISEESDKAFMNLLQAPENAGVDFPKTHFDFSSIPRFPATILAKNLFTTLRRMKDVIETCIQVELFDSHKWLQFNILYSRSFEQSSDDYTRRLQRKHSLGRFELNTGSEQGSDKMRTKSGVGPNGIRTPSAQSLDTLRTSPDNVHPETEGEQIQKEIKNRREEDLLVQDASDKNAISTSSQQSISSNENPLLALSEDAFLHYCSKLRLELSTWNESRSNNFDWNPTEPELRKLFLGGEQLHKETLCYSAYNLLGEKTHYAELVLRASRLMLKASDKTRITNPFGWMWTCLHGNGDGTHPWVQLLTADEEDGLASRLRSRVRDNHPP